MVTKAELQRLRALREKKNREARGVFVVEGEKVVGELLAAKFPFEEIYATDEWFAAAARDAAGPAAAVAERPAPTGTEGRAPSIRTIRVTREEMARASHFPTPASVLAVGRITRPPLAPGALDRGLTLALDGVQDAGNVGTLLRIADWFACDRVVLSTDCADLFHQKVINASVGSFARVRAHTVDLAAALAGVAKTTPILGCDLEGRDVHAIPPLRDALIVIGSEGRGLSESLRRFVTYYVTIASYGRGESLNAAIAAAIVCDNLRRVGGA